MQERPVKADEEINLEWFGGERQIRGTSWSGALGRCGRNKSIITIQIFAPTTRMKRRARRIPRRAR